MIKTSRKSWLIIKDSKSCYIQIKVDGEVKLIKEISQDDYAILSSIE